MYVSFLLCKRHRHFSVLGRISFFLSKWQQIAIRRDLARTPSRPSALVFGLMTTDINVAMLWRVVHKFIKRVNKVRLKTFVPYNLFHTKFSAIVAIIRWTMLLEKVFHLPQPCFSFVSVLPQNRRNPAVRRVHFATNWQLKKLEKN